MIKKNKPQRTREMFYVKPNPHADGGDGTYLLTGGRISDRDDEEKGSSKEKSFPTVNDALAYLRDIQAKNGGDLEVGDVVVYGRGDPKPYKGDFKKASKFPEKRISNNRRVREESNDATGIQGYAKKLVNLTEGIYPKFLSNAQMTPSMGTDSNNSYSLNITFTIQDAIDTPRLPLMTQFTISMGRFNKSGALVTGESGNEQQGDAIYLIRPYSIMLKKEVNQKSGGVNISTNLKPVGVRSEGIKEELVTTFQNIAEALDKVKAKFKNSPYSRKESHPRKSYVREDSDSPPNPATLKSSIQSMIRTNGGDPQKINDDQMQSLVTAISSAITSSKGGLITPNNVQQTTPVGQGSSSAFGVAESRYRYIKQYMERLHD